MHSTVLDPSMDGSGKAYKVFIWVEYSISSSTTVGRQHMQVIIICFVEHGTVYGPSQALGPLREILSAEV